MAQSPNSDGKLCSAQHFRVSHLVYATGVERRARRDCAGRACRIARDSTRVALL